MLKMATGSKEFWETKQILKMAIGSTEFSGKTGT